MKRSSTFNFALASCLVHAALLTAACTIEDDLEGGPDLGPDLLSEWDFDVKPGDSAAVDEAGRAPGILVSAELFDLASRWSAESLDTAGMGQATTSAQAAGTSLVDYVRMNAPELAAEATAAVETMDAAAGDGPVAKSNPCTCSIWGNFTPSSAQNLSGDSWTLSTRGAAHHGHIYQAVSGSTRERDTRPAPTSTKLRTRIVCTTSTGAACAAGCSGQLYADAYYSSRLYAEAHVWTIWNRAGTTQVVDGVTLDLRPPYGGSQRLREKAGSVHHWSNNKAYDPEQLANVVKAGLVIYAAIESGTGIPTDLVDETVESIFGLINSATGNNNGSHEVGMKMEFESYFDAQPILIEYQSNTNLVYGLDLTSELAMKVRGWGYHSETGDVKSSYAMAAYLDNFVCSPGVTPPQRTGFWNYDGYDGAPMSLSQLRDELRSFFYMGYGAWVDVSAQTGTLVQGVCGNNACESLETPSTCSADCGYCGNGVCNSVFENASSCTADCGYCGDGVCYGSETESSCRWDCGYCGDGVCYGYESWTTCSLDCGSGGGGCEPYLQQGEAGVELIEPCPYLP